MGSAKPSGGADEIAGRGMPHKGVVKAPDRIIET
jgi:hypothetical protein